MKFLLFRRQNQRQAGRLLFMFENLNKALGYARNLVISWMVGFGALSDLYFLIFGLAAPVSTIITGAVSATFIPYSQQFGSRGRRQLLGGSAMTTSALFLLIVVPATLLVLPTASSSLQHQANTFLGTLILLGVIVSFAATQLLQLADEFNRSRRNFMLGASLLLFVNIAAMIILYVGLRWSPVFLGWASAFPAMILAIWVYFGLRLPLWNWRTALPYIRQTMPLMLSGSMGMVNVFIDRWFAAGFPPGQLSMMQTALMLITQTGGALISPLINSAYPYFSKAFVTGKTAEAHHTVAKLEDRVVAIMYSFIIGFIAFGHFGLSLIYHHGQVRAHDVDILYEMAYWHLPVFLYGSVVSLYLRILYCRGEIKLPAKLSVAVVLINILLNLIFVESWGWRALAASASFCAWMYCLALLFFVHRRGDYHLRKSRILIINIPMAALLTWGAMT